MAVGSDRSQREMSELRALHITMKTIALGRRSRCSKAARDGIPPNAAFTTPIGEDAIRGDHAWSQRRWRVEPDHGELDRRGSIMALGKLGQIADVPCMAPMWVYGTHLVDRPFVMLRRSL